MTRTKDYTIQEFELGKDNNYLHAKGRHKKKLIFWQKTLSAHFTILEIMDNGYNFPSLKHLNVLHFTTISQL